MAELVRLRVLDNDYLDDQVTIQRQELKIFCLIDNQNLVLLAILEEALWDSPFFLDIVVKEPQPLNRVVYHDFSFCFILPRDDFFRLRIIFLDPVNRNRNALLSVLEQSLLQLSSCRSCVEQLANCLDKVPPLRLVFVDLLNDLLDAQSVLYSLHVLLDYSDHLLRTKFLVNILQIKGFHKLRVS